MLPFFLSLHSLLDFPLLLIQIKSQERTNWLTPVAVCGLAAVLPPPAPPLVEREMLESSSTGLVMLDLLGTSDVRLCF